MQTWTPKTTKMALALKRCFWVSLDKPHYVEYHDTEWGVPVHDDQRHFEMLILEGAQAGLSWETILRKRENYHESVRRVRSRESRPLHSGADRKAAARSRLGA